MNVIIGIVLMVIALPMIANKIPPNPFYGFRVRKTLENPEIWYKVNEYSGWRFFIAGAVITLASMALSLLPGMEMSTYSLVSGGLNILLIAIVIGQSTRYLNSL
jgi:uncharacterized membrane protein